MMQGSDCHPSLIVVCFSPHIAVIVSYHALLLPQGPFPLLFVEMYTEFDLIL